MLRYLLILLLVNTYGRSLGTPVFDRSTNGKILVSNLLSDLTRQCKNEFVSGQIANRIKECNVTAPPFYETEMQCLVFHDASSLLCNISTASFPKIAADFEAKTSSKLTADEFCTEAAHFDLLPTTFQTLISQVFQGDAACKKVCMDKDVLSGDTHFVCKFYKWALGILQTQHQTVQSSSTANNGPSVSGAETGDSKTSEIVTASTNNTSGVQVKEPELETTSSSSSIKVQNDQLHSNLESSSNGQSTSVLNQSTTNQTKTPVEPSLLEENDKSDKPEKQTGHDKDNVEGEGNAETALNQEIAVGANNAKADNKENVIEHPGAGAGDIGDSERDDGNDGEGDDDGDDLDGGDLDVRNSQPAPNTQLNLNGESSQREFLPNMPDGFTEDDDHFFPFFLTVVIIVIILYVLYHNKSKVGKMFFGLLVEGRQPGRRRNSRGHSYRRLDTLEQAMTANAPAPPSKIIY